MKNKNIAALLIYAIASVIVIFRSYCCSWMHQKTNPRRRDGEAGSRRKSNKNLKTYLHLVLLLVIVSFVSCVDVPINAPVSKSESGCFYVETENGILDFHFLKFEFEGHSYIRFGRYEYQTIVHDPNCACHQKDGTIVVTPDYSQPSEYLY